MIRQDLADSCVEGARALEDNIDLLVDDYSS